MHRIFIGGVAALFLIAGCTAETVGPSGLSKDEAAANVALGASGGKADETDFCEEAGWYGDGVCDWFCSLVDQDCSDAECTVGADSTCGDDEYCRPGACLLHCSAFDPDCCEPATCEPVADFCTDALCGPGTYCDEETNACVPVDAPFCPRALCAPGTTCDEEEDRCVPSDDCAPVLCAQYCHYGFATGEDGCEICECADAPEPSECGDVLCGLYCEFGFETDEDGCEVCSCAEAP